MGKPIGEYSRFDFAAVEERGRIIAQLSQHMTPAAGAWTTDPLPMLVLASGPLDRPASLFLSDGAVRAAERAGVVLGPATIVAPECLPVGVAVVFGDSFDIASWRRLGGST
ncbi:MAG: hypothetical protein ABI647_24635 [Gemmatimonadota bacterium]